MYSSYTLYRYQTCDGRDLFQEWLDALRDQKARIAIQRRVARLLLGNFGDHKFCRDGVWELRIDVGPGYRVYYAMSGNSIVILLCAGSKQGQSADITRAVSLKENFERRFEHENLSPIH